MPSNKGHIESIRFRGVKPATEGKYRQVIELYGMTVESLKSLARRFGVNDCIFRSNPTQSLTEKYSS